MRHAGDVYAGMQVVQREDDGGFVAFDVVGWTIRFIEFCGVIATLAITVRHLRIQPSQIEF